MIKSPKFWISMTLFLVVFGLAVFAITRNYYNPDSGYAGTDSSVQSQSSPILQDQIAGSSSPLINSSTFSQSSASKDPDEISRQGDEFFANKEYDLAAKRYQQLLELAPNNVDTYNNLGITLHYIGRSAEAVDKLNEGIAVDPGYQRIWLTLGYVNSQLGNIELARTALTTALNIDANNDIGQSATTMLENLP
jgi:Flp pilus assembly protein TadD